MIDKKEIENNKYGLIIYILTIKRKGGLVNANKIPILDQQILILLVNREIGTVSTLIVWFFIFLCIKKSF
jgi:hypothetical protein